MFEGDGVADTWGCVSHTDALWVEGCVPDVELLSGLLFGITGRLLVVYLCCKNYIRPFHTFSHYYAARTVG